MMCNKTIMYLRMILVSGLILNYGNGYADKIHEYAVKGDLKSIAKYLNNGGDINKTDPVHQTAMHYAAKAGNVAIINYLIARKAALNKADKIGNTPFHVAARHGSVSIMDVLLKHNIDINQSPGLVGSPLHTAVISDSKISVLYLIEHGADVNYKDFNGATVLHNAAGSSKVDIIGLLLKHGAKINEPSKGLGTPIFLAVSNNKPETVKFLLKNGADINHNSKELGTPLFFAIQRGHKEVVNLLLEKGADTNVKHNDFTPLILTAYNGYTGIANSLLSHGAEVDAINGQGMTALVFAVAYNYVPLVKILINSGADINVNFTVNDGSTLTALQIAKEVQNADMVEILERKNNSSKIWSYITEKLNINSKSQHSDWPPCSEGKKAIPAKMQVTYQIPESDPLTDKGAGGINPDGSFNPGESFKITGGSLVTQISDVPDIELGDFKASAKFGGWAWSYEDASKARKIGWGPCLTSGSIVVSKIQMLKPTTKAYTENNFSCEVLNEHYYLLKIDPSKNQKFCFLNKDLGAREFTQGFSGTKINYQNTTVEKKEDGWYREGNKFIAE